MDFKELQAKGAAELKEEYAKLVAELHALRVKAAGKQLKQVHQIGTLKKALARINTILHQRLNNDAATK